MKYCRMSLHWALPPVKWVKWQMQQIADGENIIFSLVCYFSILRVHFTATKYYWSRCKTIVYIMFLAGDNGPQSRK